MRSRVAYEVGTDSRSESHRILPPLPQMQRTDGGGDFRRTDQRCRDARTRWLHRTRALVETPHLGAVALLGARQRGAVDAATGEIQKLERAVVRLRVLVAENPPGVDVAAVGAAKRAARTLWEAAELAPGGRVKTEPRGGPAPYCAFSPTARRRAGLSQPCDAP